MPPHRKGPQVGASPMLPAGRTVQAPSAVAPSAALQTSQAPVHVALQQTPSEQEAEAHWLAAVHAAPFANLMLQV